MKKPETKKRIRERLNVVIHPDSLEKLRQLAEAERLSMSRYLERLIEDAARRADQQ